MSVTQNIINASAVFPKGISPTAWIIPWANTDIEFGNGVDLAYQNEVTKLIPAQLWFPVIEATKFGLNVGSTAVIAENKPDAYKHTFTAIMSLMSPSDKKALDEMDAIMVIVKKNRGGFSVYGAQHGLWKSAQGAMANDNSAMVTATYESRADMEEEYSEYPINMGGVDRSIELILSVDPILKIDTHVFSEATGSISVYDGADGEVTVNYQGLQNGILTNATVTAFVTEITNFVGTIYVFPKPLQADIRVETY